MAQKIAAADAGVTAPKPTAAALRPNEVYMTAAAPPQVDAPKKGFLASLFGTTPASAAPAPLINSRSGEQPAVAAEHEGRTGESRSSRWHLPSSADKPLQTGLARRRQRTDITGSDALPGVRQTALFEIKRKSGIDDESDVDLNEDEGGRRLQVASAAGLARLAPNGLLKQNESVDVACLKPSLVRVLKTIEGHYGSKMMVTSGYRTRPATAAPTAPRIAAHVLRRRRHPGSRRLQMGTGEIHPHHARPRRRRHLLPHRTPSTSTSVPSATGTGAAAGGAKHADTAGAKGWGCCEHTRSFGKLSATFEIS